MRFSPLICDDGEKIELRMSEPEFKGDHYAITLTRNDVIKLIREGAAVLLPETKP